MSYEEYDNGFVKRRGMMVNGQRHGEWKEYWTSEFTDYSICWKGTFVNGKEEGEFLTFYPRLDSAGSPGGDVWGKTKYENGVMKERVCYSRSGGITELAEFNEVGCKKYLSSWR